MPRRTGVEDSPASLLLAARSPDIFLADAAQASRGPQSSRSCTELGGGLAGLSAKLSGALCQLSDAGWEAGGALTGLLPSQLPLHV